MRSRMTLGLVVASLAAVVLLAPFGCSDSTDPNQKVLTAQFSPSGTTLRPDRVKLVELGRSGRRIALGVLLHGPTSSMDLYAFSFDILLGDPTIAQYLPASAEPGNLLVVAAGQGLDLQVSQDGSRVVVGIRKTGGGAGDGLDAGDRVIVALGFEVLRQGTTTLTLVGSPTNPQNPSTVPLALDSHGARVTEVEFDPAAAVLSAL